MDTMGLIPGNETRRRTRQRKLFDLDLTFLSTIRLSALLVIIVHNP